jgi:curved DNA-binding protein CbpA
VPIGASRGMIRRQYRKLSKLWHPDRCRVTGNDPIVAQERMKRINEAYALISDAPLKVRYDLKGQERAPVSPPLYPRKWDTTFMEPANLVEILFRFVLGTCLMLLWMTRWTYSPLYDHLNGWAGSAVFGGIAMIYAYDYFAFPFRWVAGRFKSKKGGG